jgi:hypothetical protein
VTPAPAPTLSPRLAWSIALAVPLVSLVIGIAALPSPNPGADGSGSSVADAVSKTAPKPTVAMDVVLGDDEIRFLGADLPSAPVSPGGPLAITLHFAAQTSLEDDWQVFVHIDDKTTRYRIHGDHYPALGKMPTTLWQPGTYVADRWRTIVPRDAPSGRYEVWVGLYIGDDRMSVSDDDRAATDGQDRIKVGTILVE